jgi:hypothetical protein
MHAFELTNFHVIAPLARLLRIRETYQSGVFPMRTKFLSAVAAVAVVAIANVAPASAAVFPVGTTTPGVGSFQAAMGPNGTYNGAISRVGIGAGTFSDTFTFTLPATGLGSGSVISSTVLMNGVTSLTFSKVTFNGMDLTIGALGNLVFAGGDALPVAAGQLNTLMVSGTSQGGASYGGNLTFIPSAVPETATWMMMLAGFGMMGAGLRYRRRSSTVAFA